MAPNLWPRTSKRELNYRKPRTIASWSRNVCPKILEVSTEAYNQYEQRTVNEGVSLRKEAARTIEHCVAQFEEMARKTIRKSGESKQASESRIWSENSELFDEYCTAQRQLLTPETR